MKTDTDINDHLMTIIFTCRQFGDSGKGKVGDIVALLADYIFRGTGGPNAGHTVEAGVKKIILHLIPSGILYDSLGKINVIGNGTVIFPKLLINELEELAAMGLSYNNLKIAYNANLILPTHLLFDQIREIKAGSGKIGSTGKGIGPAYADRVDRYGLIMNDLLNPTILWAKLNRHLDYKEQILKNYDRDQIREILSKRDLESGLFSKRGLGQIFDRKAIYTQYLEYGKQLSPYICDTDKLMKEAYGKKRILIEGAQGDLLSVEKGTYPFVTSSDCTVSGLLKGVGLNDGQFDLSLGIIKGFYMTRVGCGPFPTEMGGCESERWCNDVFARRDIELSKFGIVNPNDSNEFLQGIAIRQAGNEYGATTKRPRRCGWLDLPLLRYTLTFNSPDMCLTKLDVLDKCERIKICKQYRYVGEDILWAGKTLKKGDILEVAIPANEILSHCEPIYEEFPGWLQDTTKCREFSDLPRELVLILDYVINETGIKVHMISVGPDREETIFLPDSPLRALLLEHQLT